MEKLIEKELKGNTLYFPAYSVSRGSKVEDYRLNILGYDYDKFFEKIEKMIDNEESNFNDEDEFNEWKESNVKTEHDSSFNIDEIVYFDSGYDKTYKIVIEQIDLLSEYENITNLIVEELNKSLEESEYKDKIEDILSYNNILRLIGNNFIYLKLNKLNEVVGIYINNLEAII